MKNIILAVAVLFFIGTLTAQATSVSWDLTANVLQPIANAYSAVVKGAFFQATSTTATSTFPNLTSSKVQISTLTSQPCVGTDANGIVVSGTCSGGATIASGTISTDANFTVTANRQAIGGTAAFGLATGLTIPTTTGLQTLYASSHNPVTLAGTATYLSIAGQVITQAFINLGTQVSSVLAVLNGGTGTSTVPTTGQVLVGQSNGTYAPQATSTLGISGGGSGTVTSVAMTTPTGLTVSGSPITTAGTLALTYTAGYEGLLSASSSNYNSFFTTPSSRISAGTNLSWSGNTLNCASCGGAGATGTVTWLLVPNGLVTATGTDFAQAAYFNASSTTGTSTFAGRVGIGTTTPSTTLQVIGTTTTSGLSISTLSGILKGVSGAVGLATAGIDYVASTSGDWLGTFQGQGAAYYLARANHTGTQLAATISDFATAARALFSSTATGLTYTSGTGVISLTGGFIIPTTASTTNYDTFYGTPSTRITAGTGLTWSGNTLNAAGGGTNYLTNSGTDTFLNTGSNLQSPTFQATSTTGISTFSGSVGIGSTTPAAKLGIAGGLTMTGNLRVDGLNSALVLNSPVLDSAGRNGVQFLNNSIGYFSGDDHANQAFNFYSTFSATRTRSATLSVYGSSTGTYSNALTLTHTGPAGYGLISTDVGPIILSSASSSVGIGTTSPSSLLTVAGTAYISGGLTAASTLLVSGAATLNSTLSVFGASTLTGLVTAPAGITTTITNTSGTTVGITEVVTNNTVSLMSSTLSGGLFTAIRGSGSSTAPFTATTTGVSATARFSSAVGTVLASIGLYGAVENTGVGTTTTGYSIFGARPLASAGAFLKAWAGGFNGSVWIADSLSIGTTSTSSLLSVATTTSSNLFSVRNDGQVTMNSTPGNASVGNVTLVAGVATVNTTAATANSFISLTLKTAGGTAGTTATYSTTAGSFTITSASALDTSVYTYVIMN